MPSPNPLSTTISPHILSLLSSLHKKSLEQEKALTSSSNDDSHKFTSPAALSALKRRFANDLSSEAYQTAFDALMLDKFIALDEDKCQFMYQLLNAMNATNVVEAGTSFGVSTIYLALAVSRQMKVTGKTDGKVIATEKEAEKADVARGYWRECGEEVEGVIDLRVGDLRETLKVDLPETIDLLLLDIWCPLALPTLKTVLPRFRPGTVVLTDNTIAAAEGYAELLSFFRDPKNGFQNQTLPFTNGFEMSVYMPQK